MSAAPEPSSHAEAAPAKLGAWVLPLGMFLGALLGLVLGATMGERWDEPDLESLVLSVRALGRVFLAALRGLVVPLVVTSVITGVTGMGDLRKVGRAAGATMAYFVGTTLLAVLTGIALVATIRPGVGTDASHAASHAAELTLPSGRAETVAQAIYGVVTGLVPENVVGAAAEGNILGLIVFSIAFGLVLSSMGDRAGPLTRALVTANEALLRLVTVVVWAAPVGIFGLVADRVGHAGGGAAVWHELVQVGWYAVTVLTGLGIHAFVTLPLFVLLVARRSPLAYARGMVDSLLTSFGTASSAATMAVTLECVIDKNRVSRRAADLVIPLGTTINMNGTALYEAVAVIFIAQSLGVELSAAQHLVIAVTATLAAIGAAAIPEAGLVTMLLVLGAVGLPAEGVGLLLSIDWILDRFRTSVNVWGDAVGAAVVERFVPRPGASEALAIEAGPTDSALQERKPVGETSLAPADAAPSAEARATEDRPRSDA